MMGELRRSATSALTTRTGVLLEGESKPTGASLPGPPHGVARDCPEQRLYQTPVRPLAIMSIPCVYTPWVISGAVCKIRFRPDIAPAANSMAIGDNRAILQLPARRRLAKGLPNADI
jgi:hypothetical protein